MIKRHDGSICMKRIYGSTSVEQNKQRSRYAFRGFHQRLMHFHLEQILPDEHSWLVMEYEYNIQRDEAFKRMIWDIQIND